MFGIGPEELVLLLIIALIVLGPERMPKVARDIGRVVGDLRRTSDELREEFLNADRILDSAAATASRPASTPPRRRVPRPRLPRPTARRHSTVRCAKHGSGSSRSATARAHESAGEAPAPGRLLDQDGE